MAEVTLLEVVSNLRRLLDVDRLITDEEFDVLLATFFDDLARELLQVVRLSHAVLATSLDIASRRYVTPLDAVQLASALALPEPPVFVCADQKLLRLAEELGLETVDVSRDV
ncbi:MAG: type II toxin-antitoxin system VapC family toxin [Firmicutes bacterium]|nr:type II toxin-antitoxin system VapC family toxin [Bacillota bacterium]